MNTLGPPRKSLTDVIDRAGPAIIIVRVHREFYFWDVLKQQVLPNTVFEQVIQ